MRRFTLFNFIYYGILRFWLNTRYEILLLPRDSRITRQIFRSRHLHNSLYQDEERSCWWFLIILEAPLLFVLLERYDAVKGIVQRILRGVNTRVNTKLKKIRPRKLETRPIFYLNFKGTPSQEEHKTIFNGLKINKMALSG